MESFWQDFRLGLRVLGRRVVFTGTAILTLALGTGASIAIFSVFNGVLLRDLPYTNAQDVVVLWQKDLAGPGTEGKVSPANFLDWRDRNTAFRGMASVETFGFDLATQDEPERVRAWLVTEGFFRILGTPAQHGRTFLPAEESGEENAVVLSFDLWQRRYGSDPGIVGRKILLSGRPFTVQGVMPAEFQFPEKGGVWVSRPLSESHRQDRAEPYLTVIGHLKPGITAEQAQRAMDTVVARLAQEYPDVNGGKGVSVVPLREQIVGHIRPALVVLLGAVGLVLLLTCVNVANLVLLLAVQRRREIASRAALGATPRRLARQLLTEHSLLVLIGTSAGLLLALWGIDILRALSPADLPRIDEVGIDNRVLAFAVGVAALSALLVGLTLLVQVSRRELQNALREGGRNSTSGRGGQRLREALVVSEIAAALVLLIGTGLLIRSFLTVLDVDPGFGNQDGVALEMHVWGKYRTEEERARFFMEAQERLAAAPGIAGAGAASAIPLSGNRIERNTAFSIVGRPAPSPAQQPTAYQTIVTTGYFEAIQIPLRRGRGLSRADHGEAPRVALINQTLAKRYFGNTDPVGERLVLQTYGPPAEHEIVGVVGDVTRGGLDQAPQAEVFVPHLQNPTGSMTFVVRPRGSSELVLQRAKETIWGINPGIAFSSAVTFRQLMADSLRERRFSLLIVGAFALVALALAATGTYGLISFAVDQRTREMGLRLALGAQKRDILLTLLRTKLGLILTGVIAGLALSILLTRFLQGLLFGIGALDPATFAGMSALIVAVGLLASYLPARRATRIEPMLTLRAD